MEEILKLWTRSVPYCEEGDGVQKEHFIASDDPVQRLTDVSVPEISAFPVCSWKKVPAVLVCPGVDTIFSPGIMKAGISARC